MFGAASSSQYFLTRICFQRGLAFIYFIGFLIAINQSRGLIGERGLLPVRLFLSRVSFWDAPGLFWINHSNVALMVVAWAGLILSILALTGVSEAHGLAVSVAVWALLWVFYLSFVNVGQTFYGFGWETLLLETGFLSIFLGSSDTRPPVLIFWLLRWLLFRVMFGAGMIKLRGDPCWRELTCLTYHYETQPLPHALSWFLHRLPAWYHKACVLFTHVAELVVPFGVFGPRFVRYAAGGITIYFQLMLILSGNLSWLNYITALLAIACFDDALLTKLIPFSLPAAAATQFSTPHAGAVLVVTGIVILLSIRPAMNLFSRNQMMNASFEPLHLVNTYGAFGSVTRKRLEVVLEGTDDAVITSATQWREYEFRAKPGAPGRRPRLVSPYHFKIDWQMWFAAMTSYHRHPWLLNLVAKLLKNERDVVALLQGNPFPDRPPKFIRARWYEYHFTDWGEKAWWRRTLVDEYLPPLFLDHPEFREVLRAQGWLE